MWVRLYITAWRWNSNSLRHMLPNSGGHWYSIFSWAKVFPLEFLKVNSLIERTNDKIEEVSPEKCNTFTLKNRTAVESSEETCFMGGLNVVSLRSNSWQRLGDHVVSNGRVQPMWPVREPFRVLHRISPVVGVSMIRQNLKFNATKWIK